MLHVLRHRAYKRPILSTRYEAWQYLWATMAHEATETFRVLFLNEARYLIADEIHGVGNSDQVVADPKTLIIRALELRAAGMILVHNHPSGDPMPSEADRRMTQRLSLAGHYLDIKVFDHLVVARDGYEVFQPLPLPSGQNGRGDR